MPLSAESLTFGTKADTLARLEGCVKKSRVLPQVAFSVASYRKEQGKLLSRVQEKFAKGKVIVRSSAIGEDSATSSMAGQFTSVAGLGTDSEELAAAIDRVIRSYGEGEEHQVLVQPMIGQIKRCGVVMTADMETLSPYYFIDADLSGRHDVVTGGSGGERVSYVHYKRSELEPSLRWVRELIEACRECEVLFENEALDIEFAFDSEDRLYLLQVRPIVRRLVPLISCERLDDALSKVASKVEKICGPHPELLGESGMLGVMPDWNPAEIIGLKPRPLALTLYQELVTNQVWAYQRDNYGYRSLRSHPLLISLLGVPYIDVRVSFNSFVPASLGDPIAEKLVDIYLKRLRAYPENHDKVEFEIVSSCYTLDLPERMEALREEGLSAAETDEISRSLLALTRRILCPRSGLCRSDLEKVEGLEELHNRVMTSSLHPIEKIYWLVEHCKRHGTLPFAGVARAAFVATQFLDSLVTSDLLNPTERSQFLRSLSTVSSELTRDLAWIKSEGGKERFLLRYGHLRPGTYDLLSYRYDEAFESYFPEGVTAGEESAPFVLPDERMEAISIELRRHQLGLDASALFAFMQMAIVGRERAKFLFTRTLSDAMQLILQLGERVGLRREEMAYLNIGSVLSLYHTLDARDLKEHFLHEIERNKEMYAYTQAVHLPLLIGKPQEVYTFASFSEEPTYVTLKRISAEPVVVDEEASLAGKIACIRSADPGYDYLFAQGISGLVTAYGGANSHMAIRCAELGIPAVIGAGEVNFTKWSGAGLLEIDAANKTCAVIR